MLLDQTAQIMIRGLWHSKKNVLTILQTLLLQWVYCCILLCYNNFRRIHDVKHDISDRQRDASDKNQRQTVLAAVEIGSIDNF